MSGATEEKIQVACACGKKLKAPMSAIGRRARCPACQAVVTIAAPPAEEETDFFALAEAAESAGAAATIDMPRCPQCSTAMNATAVLCTNCGYDTRTGKKLATAAPARSLPYATPGSGRKRPVDRMAPDGSFIMGLAFSALFALGASILWIGFSYATGYIFGYIAIAIGIAAGVGMQVGHKGFSNVGGFSAAGFTLGAILLAKLIVLQLFLIRGNIHHSIADVDPAKLGYYLFRPMSVIIMIVGMAAAYRTASGSVRD